MRATAAAGSLMVLSTMSTTSLEAVATACEPSTPRWFQLYVLRDRDATRQLVMRAERAGYTALVLTVDTPITGSREKDVRNKFKLPEGLSLTNLQQQSSMDNSNGSGLTALFAAQIDSGLTFEIIPWLRSITSMPILVKGVLRGSDAVQAVQRGASGIIVSNHGGRQADYAPATVDVLAEVCCTILTPHRIAL
jgi:4-hydroxymandelate oxidase